MALLRQHRGLSGGTYVSTGTDPTTLDFDNKAQLVNKLMKAGLQGMTDRKFRQEIGKMMAQTEAPESALNPRTFYT